jgi:hypothetical protein
LSRIVEFRPLRAACARSQSNFSNGVRKGRSIRTNIPKVIRPEIFSAKFAFRALRGKRSDNNFIEKLSVSNFLPPAPDMLLKHFTLYQSIVLEDLYNFVFECVTIGPSIRRQISGN